MIRDAIAMELHGGEMIIVSAYGRGAVALPARVALISILAAQAKVTIAVTDQEIGELIDILTQQRAHLLALADAQPTAAETMGPHGWRRRKTDVKVVE